MKKWARLFVCFTIFMLAGCAQKEQTETDLHLHFADLYPQLCPVKLDENVSMERKNELKMVALSCLEPENKYAEESYEIKVSLNYVEVSIQISDEWLRSRPDGWDDITKEAEETALLLYAAMRECGTHSFLLLCDSKNILLSFCDSEIVYEKFKQSNCEQLQAINSENSKAFIHESEVSNVAVSQEDNNNPIVYVSTNGHKIHSISDCSGMKHYVKMALSEAIENNYQYCLNCW